MASKEKKVVILEKPHSRIRVDKLHRTRLDNLRCKTETKHDKPEEINHGY
jgi:hypothetical protein